MPYPAAYAMTGDLSFGSPPDFSANGYQTAYANALSLNKQNYANILQGYQGLTKNVTDTLEGIDASQRQGIQDQYVAASGRQAQGLISRGLGNTTVANAIQRGLEADKAKADIDLTNKTQNLQAGYRSSLGRSQLDFMNSVMANYPNADAYMKLQMMQGARGARAQPVGLPSTGGAHVANFQTDPFGVGARMRAAGTGTPNNPAMFWGYGGSTYTRGGGQQRMSEADIAASQQAALDRGGYGSQGRYPAEWEQDNYLGGQADTSLGYGGFGGPEEVPFGGGYDTMGNALGDFEGPGGYKAMDQPESWQDWGGSDYASWDAGGGGIDYGSYGENDWE